MLVGPGETIGLIAVAFAFVKILGPLGAAIADRVRGRRGREPEPQMLEELDALRERVNQLEQAQVRVMELEERVDFTERLLAQPAQPGRTGTDSERSGR
jgi:hypothetical protein